MASILFKDQVLEGFEFSETYGCYYVQHRPAPFSIVVGQKYLVTWDGITYECEGYAVTFGQYNVAVLGNKLATGAADSGEPFAISYNAEYDNVEFYSFTPNNHTIEIYIQTASHLPLQSFTFIKVDEGLYGYQGITTCEPLKLGVSYTVNWDGTDYPGVASIVDGIPALGNGSVFGGTPTGEPFLLTVVDGALLGEDGNVMVAYSFEEDCTEHTIAITERSSIDVVVAHSAVPFQYTSWFEMYIWETYGDTDTYPEPQLFQLVDGQTYYVIWDGFTYKCVAKYVASGGIVGTGIGNFGLVGIGDDTGEPFIIGVFADGSDTACLTIDAGATHSIFIYQVNESGGSIVLKNYSGVDVTYENVPAVMFDTPDGGTQVFTQGSLITGLSTSLDFSNGNQVITTPSGTLAKSATLIKPATLLPENIRSGITIAGIEGEFIGDTEELALSLSMADGDMVITPTADGKVISQATITKPETLIPENIAEGVEIAGVVGTFKGGGAIEGVYKVTFYSWDGQLLLERYCYQGDDCPCPVEQGRVTVSETRDPSNLYVYGNWCGWAKAPDIAAQTDVLKNVTEEMTLYAAYEVQYENIVPEQEVAFSYNSDDQAYESALFTGTITEGETYIVVWDGTPYTLVCKTGAGGVINNTINISTTNYLGDPTLRRAFIGFTIVWKVSSSGEPFYVGQYNNGQLSIYTQNSASKHTIWIYK